jgi:hypothetical protein
MEKVNTERLITYSDINNVALHKVYLGTVDGIKCFSANGNWIKIYYSIAFVEGGNGWVYDFIPKEEAWVDEKIAECCHNAILLHEIEEIFKMRDGWDYEKAHEYANKIELKYRIEKGIL